MSEEKKLRKFELLSESDSNPIKHNAYRTLISKGELSKGERLDVIETKPLIDELRAVRGTLEMDCGDNSCMFAKFKTGMRTNGGCRCFGGLNMVKKGEIKRALTKLDTLIKEIEE